MKGRNFTPELVVDRLEEAAHTLRRLPPVKVQGYVSSWPAVVRDSHEAYGYNEAQVKLGPPSSVKIDEMDEALHWMLCLNKEEAKLVWLRANRVRWKVICIHFGLKKTKAHGLWLMCVYKIVASLSNNQGKLMKTNQKQAAK
jgi:hypothetical protein